MGKETGFLEYKRRENTMIPPRERIKTFGEMYQSLPEEERRQQAAVCMNCGVPFCQSGMMLGGMLTGCPLHNLIPEWNDAIYHGSVRHAFERLIKTNPFPEFTGRVCPALCEKACMCGQYGDSVTIHDNEKYLIEEAFEKGYIHPRIPKKRSGKKIAVVGSGPAGLAAADYLNRRGHEVTVFERDDETGGLLMYGIPNMKLEKSVIRRRRRLMEDEGVRFLCGVNVGVDVKASDIKKEFDAAVLCCGAKQARSIPACDPESVSGIYYAVDFLTRTTKALLNAGTEDINRADKADYISAKGKNVVIIGGGDTGNDCIGTSIRHGAKTVTAVEMMPKPPKERGADNPWPQWPKVLKTDYGHSEAIEVFGKDVRRFSTTVKEVKTDKEGRLKSVCLVKVAFENGKIVQIKGSEEEIPCDILLIAVGFTGCEKYVPEDFSLKLSSRGNVSTERESHMTGEAGVFTAGDMRTGQSLVVRAIADGLAAAGEVDEYLMGYSN